MFVTFGKNFFDDFSIFELSIYFIYWYFSSFIDAYNILNNKMKVHNSTEMSPAQYQEKKFYIKYQETAPKRKKARYAIDKQTDNQRALTSSEADAYKLKKSVPEQRKSQQPVTQRHQRKKVSLVTPSLVFGSMMQIIEEKKTSIEAGVVSKRQEKQMPRIPIEYNQQKANGLLADLQRLKVVYRGYAPKNTYYFFRALTSKGSFFQMKSKSRSEFQLQFNSKFESGNLSGAARKTSRQYYLYIREDTNTYGLRQWFYFSIYNRKSGKFKFRIYRFSKFYSLYKEGMRPFIRNDRNDVEWKQGGLNVKYEYDFQLKSYYLEFEYEFLENYTNTEFASQPPYTYSMLKNYLELAAQKYPLLKLRKAGTSLAGLEIPKIQIKSKNKNSQSKQAIIIIARTHPSEVASNYSLESLIDRIYQLDIVRQAYDFHIIPMVNPDGVFLGNHRTGVLGQDLNRNFNTQQVQFFPEIEAIQKLIERVKSEQNIAFLFDFHGHSAKRNIFAFGDEHLIGSLSYLNSRIIPKILGDLISTFKYSYCVFKSSKEKKNTARVYFSKKFKINAITFEQSYGLIDQGPIGIQHWKNFGTAVIDALKFFIQNCEKGNDQKMGEYLKQVMQKEIERNEKKLKKKLQKERQKSEQLKKDEEMNKSIDKDVDQDDMFKKIKTEINAKKSTKIQFEIPVRKRRNTDSSINSSELSSGDEDLENDQQGLDALKKEIIKIGCLKEGTKREKYNLAQKHLEMRGNYEPRLHEQRSSMIPRILKYQMRKREEEKQELAFNFRRISEQKSNRKRMKSIVGQKTFRESIQLPSLRR